MKHSARYRETQLTHWDAEEPNDKEQEYIQLVKLLRVTHAGQSCGKDSKIRGSEQIKLRADRQM